MKTSPKKVLIVDDDFDSLTLLTTVVKSMGLDVVTAENQKDAEKLMETVHPDLAIFDLMMENQDSGFILSYKIKKKYPDTKVIIATAVTAETGMLFNIENEEDKKWIRADLYMEKSIRPEQLRNEITKLLNL